MDPEVTGQSPNWVVFVLFTQPWVWLLIVWVYNKDAACVDLERMQITSKHVCTKHKHQYVSAKHKPQEMYMHKTHKHQQVYL